MEEEKWGNDLRQEMEILVSIRIHGFYLILSCSKILFFFLSITSVITYLREKKSSFLDGPNLLYPPSPRPSLVKPGHELYRTKGCGSVGTGADRNIFLLG